MAHSDFFLRKHEESCTRKHLPALGVVNPQTHFVPLQKNGCCVFTVTITKPKKKPFHRRLAISVNRPSLFRVFRVIQNLWKQLHQAFEGFKRLQGWSECSSNKNLSFVQIWLVPSSFELREASQASEQCFDSAFGDLRQTGFSKLRKLTQAQKGNDSWHEWWASLSFHWMRYNDVGAFPNA